jgi:hypothetical protein
MGPVRRSAIGAGKSGFEVSSETRCLLRHVGLGQLPLLLVDGLGRAPPAARGPGYGVTETKVPIPRQLPPRVGATTTLVT